MNRNKRYVEWRGMNDSLHPLAWIIPWMTEHEWMIRWMIRNKWFIEWSVMNDSLNEQG